MKFIIYLLITFISISSNAEQVFYEFGTSIYTYHYFSWGTEKFSNKYTDDGKGITNTLYSFGYGSKYDTNYYKLDTLLVGEDSIASPMIGWLRSYGFMYKYYDVAFCYGGYFYNQNNWEERYANYEIRTPSTFESFTGIPLQIVIGLELNFKLQITKKLILKLRNVITPLITNHTININYYY